MIIQKEKCKCSVTEVILLALSVLLLAGCRSWFAVCPVMSETVMSCHWAGEVLKAVSAVLLILAVIHILIPDEKMKMGMDLTLAAFGILTAFLPGVVINLCMMPEMACRAHTRPWTVVLCVVMAVVALADLLFYGTRLSQSKHRRKDAA